MSERPRVVIIGAGFAGLTLARALRRAPVDVTLIDRNNYHLFTPLLYQVASALLSPGDIAQPVRKLVRRLRNVHFRLGTVTSIDQDDRVVHTEEGHHLHYDWLVMAVGSTNNYFGNSSIEARSLGLKDLPQATHLRNRVLERFEEARWSSSTEEQEALMTFAVVGAGPTGVEYAGALSELIRQVLSNDFRGLDVSKARVILIEGQDRVLGTFHPKLSAAALRSLRHKRVEVMLGALVQEVRPAEIVLKNGQRIAARTVIWTAGVRGSAAGRLVGVPVDRQGRVAVEPTLQLPGRPEVLVIGDLSNLDDLPMMAPVAIQQAKHAARVITSVIAGRAPEPFQYHDPGTMATIGRNSGVAQLGRVRLWGFPGWVMWLVVHLLNIVTFRARFAVLFQWAYEYVFLDRPIRIILEANRRRDED